MKAVGYPNASRDVVYVDGFCASVLTTLFISWQIFSTLGLALAAKVSVQMNEEIGCDMAMLMGTIGSSSIAIYCLGTLVKATANDIWIE